MIYRRGKTFWFKFDWQGARIYKSAKTKNERVAAQVERAYRTALAKGEVGLHSMQSRSPRLVDFRGRFFAQLTVDCKTRTIGFYNDAWKCLTSFNALATTRLALIDRALIDVYIQEKSKTLSPATVNGSLRTLRRALKLAEQWGIIQKCPKIKMVPGERTREFIFTDKVRQDVLDNAGDNFKPIFVFLIETGLRITEACELKWDRVSFYPLGEAKRGYIYIDRGKSKNAKRYIPMSASCKSVLESLRGQSKSEFVFTRTDRIRPMSRHTVSEQFRKIKHTLNLPWDAVLHSTRHTMLTNLGSSGADAFTIMKLAGHGSVVTSQRYIHPVSETIERAFDRMERVLPGTDSGTTHKMFVVKTANA